MTMLPLAVSFLSGENVPYIILGLGAFVILYVVIRPMLRRKKDPFEKPFRARSLSQQRSVERQMESLLVELSEMTRQMTAQLETRSAKLEALIEEADEKILEMKALAERRPEQQIRGVPAEPLPPPSGGDGRVEIAKFAASQPEVDPAHAAVYELSDAGRSVQEISAALQRPSGEIELILALRAPR